jgi:hypothetical protein
MPLLVTLAMLGWAPLTVAAGPTRVGRRLGARLVVARVWSGLPLTDATSGSWGDLAAGVAVHEQVRRRMSLRPCLVDLVASGRCGGAIRVA